MVGACTFHLDPDLHPGYRLQHRLGQGGFGEVWLAEKADRKLVALKFMRCRGNNNSLQELRSLQLVSGLNHPNILRIDQVWAIRDFLVIAMPLADCSLADLLDIYQSETGAAVPAQDLLPLFLQAARGIDFLNSPVHQVDGRRVGIQHADVSPGNLLLFGDKIKLSDFSLTATMMGPRKSRVSAGKTDFAPPEVFQQQLSNQSDQYALAVSYCQLRGGRMPFPDSPLEFVRGYLRPEPDLSMLEPCERPIIARALADTPETRWPTCVAWVERIAAEVSRNVGHRKPKLAVQERRRATRHRPAKTTACRLMGLAASESVAQIVDISRTGMSLILNSSEREYRSGQVILVLLTHGLETARLAKLSVVHCEQLPNREKRLGGVFGTALTEEEAKLLFGDSAPAE